MTADLLDIDSRLYHRILTNEPESMAASSVCTIQDVVPRLGLTVSDLRDMIGEILDEEIADKGIDPKAVNRERLLRKLKP